MGKVLVRLRSLTITKEHTTEKSKG